MRKVIPFFRRLFDNYLKDDAFNLGAALAYYTTFSFAPMLVIVVAIASTFLGEEAVSGSLSRQLAELLGQDAAESLTVIIKNAYSSGETFWATALSTATLIFASTGVFSNLKISLNRIWNIETRPTNGILAFFFTRVLSLSFVIGLGFLLMVTLVISALIIGFMDQIAAQLPGLGPVVLGLTSWVLSTLFTAVIFATLFRFLPDAIINWKDVWAGALFTAILFGLGRWLIGFYIGNSNFSSTYGAAGALVTLLVWTYYNSQILFLGAEFSYVWAEFHDRPVVPKPHAVVVEKKVIVQSEGSEV